jgi:hypothetical protein
MLLDSRLRGLGAHLFDVSGHGRRPDPLQPQSSLLAPIEEVPDGQGMGHLGVRLRMFAVKNSMKRSLVWAPAAAIATGSVSGPARTSAGGAATTSASLKTMGSFTL